MKAFILTARLWFITSVSTGLFYGIFGLLQNDLPWWGAFLIGGIALLLHIPVFILLYFLLGMVKRKNILVAQKIMQVGGFFFMAYLAYSIFIFFILNNTLISKAFYVSGIVWLLMQAGYLAAIGLSTTSLHRYFTSHHQKYINMESNLNLAGEPATASKNSNKILIKAIITGALILAMLIPTIFISNLVSERKMRQTEVVAEVSDKWAQPQLLTGPYIYLPYKVFTTDKDNHSITNLAHLIILPDSLLVDGKINHEIRLRSIYKVLLYQANLNHSGNFIFNIPKEIDSSHILWQDAKICYGLSDFKGIEKKLVLNFNGTEVELNPGLPTNDISKNGLSANLPLLGLDAAHKNSFSLNVQIKGSEQLHFVPLAGESKFSLQSGWGSPSFDGNNLPSFRSVKDSGFTASWSFNKANLPFGTTLKDFNLDVRNLSFGVTMVQPADAYAKTDRSIKYAILFIGLTFALFFIIELLQKKSVHPVQYILIGLALIIFYTLLLSMSEFIAFDMAYLIAAAATILLISLYAYGHFKNFKTAAVFASILSLLYAFTFVLIRMEDAALLIGSIGLFVILALAMYASRKINWYGA